MGVNDDRAVAPGEKLATEEEFKNGQNTYVENGVIYSSVFGSISKKDGTVSVVSGTGREVKVLDKGMIVIGTVTDNMRSVIFIKLDHITVGRKEFLALKDGKIIPERPRPGRAPMGRMGRDNKFHEANEKLCDVGDTILARILYNDKDSYALGLREPELGVIYAKCGACGDEMSYNREAGMLVCNVCGNGERRKVSMLYGAPEKIKALFT